MASGACAATLCLQEGQHVLLGLGNRGAIGLDAFQVREQLLFLLFWKRARPASDVSSRASTMRASLMEVIWNDCIIYCLALTRITLAQGIPI